MINDYFVKNRETVQVVPYALYDTLHALTVHECECIVSKEDDHLVVHYCKRPKVSCTDEPTSDAVNGQKILAEKDKDALKFNDWNDVSNTKIPLNEEIFALLQDRMDPEKLRPEVIVAHMYPAKSLTWTENKEGDVLCYDVSAGNFHCCNGNQIKYWKYVNVPR